MMRRREIIVGRVVCAGALLAAAAMSRGSLTTQALAECNRTCPAGAPRDAEGCCRVAPKARTPNGSATQAPSASPPPSASTAPVALAATIALPGGQFKMGQRGDVVSVNPFHLDTTEVTVAAYGACVSQGRCVAPDPGDHCNWGRPERSLDPMNCVDWNEASAFCNAHDKRLPTEEEWEWAAMGAGRATRFPWGNAEPGGNQICWQRWDSRAGTCPAGSLPRGDSPQGVKDLAGNVWEWTSGTYNGTTDRVFRGGAWARVDVTEFTASIRGWRPPAYKFFDVGFRCARDR
jgi:formylglycine-generating enzyme